MPATCDDRSAFCCLMAAVWSSSLLAAMVPLGAPTLSATMPANRAASTMIQMKAGLSRDRVRLPDSWARRGRDAAPRGRAVRGAGPFRRPQLGRRGPRVLTPLVDRGYDGPAGQRAQHRLVAADADRELRRAGAAAGAVADEPLDD